MSSPVTDFNKGNSVVPKYLDASAGYYSKKQTYFFVEDDYSRDVYFESLARPIYNKTTKNKVSLYVPLKNFNPNINSAKYNNDFRKIPTQTNNNDKSKNAGYSYVINTMKRCNDNKKRYANSDFYGIIDYDSGQHTDDLPLNTFQTGAHDVETTVAETFFPIYYREKINTDAYSLEEKEFFIKSLSDILFYTSMQGALERASFAYVRKNKLEEDSQLNIRLTGLTHSYFNCKEYRNIEKFNFENHLMNQGEEWINELSALFNDEKKLLCNEKNKFRDIIKKWLKGKLNGEEKQIIRQVFVNTNGHFLFKLLVQYFGTTFGLKSREGIENIFLHMIQNNSEKMFSLSPMYDYKEIAFKKVK